MSDAEIEALGRKILAAQPYSQSLGTKIVSMGMGRAELCIPIHDGLTQHLHMVHGGVIATLADMALAFAGGPIMGEGAVTQEFKINFLRPGKGDRLIARGMVVASGRTQAVVRADVFVVVAGEERLCATAQGTIAAVKTS